MAENRSVRILERRTLGIDQTGEVFDLIVPDFARYVRWSTDGSVGTPTIQIECIAKEY